MLLYSVCIRLQMTTLVCTTHSALMWLFYSEYGWTTLAEVLVKTYHTEQKCLVFVPSQPVIPWYAIYWYWSYWLSAKLSTPQWVLKMNDQNVFHQKQLPVFGISGFLTKKRSWIIFAQCGLVALDAFCKSVSIIQVVKTVFL